MTLPPPPPPPSTGTGVASSLPPPPAPPTGAAYEPRWGIVDGIIALALFIAVSVVLAVAWAISVGGDVDATIDGPWLPGILLGSQVAMGGYAVWAVRTKGHGVVADLRLRFEWVDVGIGLGLAFAGLIGAGIVAEITVQLLGEDPNAAVADLIEDSSEGGGLSFWIVFTAVAGATLVPLVEELVFRGLWWEALERRGLRAGTALVVTSLVFAAFHLEPYRFPVLFTLGLALGAGRYLTGRLGPAIVAHGVINGLAFSALLVELA